MQRKFNQGVNQLPQSSVGSKLYPIPAKLKAGETTGEHLGCYQIDSYDSATNTYTVVMPTGDSIPTAQLLFSPAKADASARIPAGYCDPARWVSFDATGGVPTIGDDVGTQAGSYKLLKGNSGFKCISYNAAEGLCLVRPFSSSLLTINSLGDVPRVVESTSQYASYYTLDTPYVFPSSGGVFHLCMSSATTTDFAGFAFSVAMNYAALLTKEVSLIMEFCESDNTPITSAVIMRISPLDFTGTTAYMQADVRSSKIFDRFSVGSLGADKTATKIRMYVNSHLTSLWSISTGETTFKLGVITGEISDYIAFT